MEERKSGSCKSGKTHKSARLQEWKDSKTALDLMHNMSLDLGQLRIYMHNVSPVCVICPRSYELHGTGDVVCRI